MLVICFPNLAQTNCKLACISCFHIDSLVNFVLIVSQPRSFSHFRSLSVIGISDNLYLLQLIRFEKNQYFFKIAFVLHLQILLTLMQAMSQVQTTISDNSNLKNINFCTYLASSKYLDESGAYEM